jgi:hypothetical protein
MRNLIGLDWIRLSPTPFDRTSKERTYQSKSNHNHNHHFALIYLAGRRKRASASPAATQLPSPLRLSLALLSSSEDSQLTAMPVVRPTTTGTLLRPSSRAIRGGQRQFSASTPKKSGADPHYDPPTGWLWGVPPGQKYKNQGWENWMFYGFGGAVLATGVAYAFKPDTRYVGMVFLGWPSCFL